MEEIIKWLVYIEKCASVFYKKSAIALNHDQELFTFLNHLSEDEDYHVKLLEKASEHLINIDTPIEPAILVDEDFKAKIEEHFLKCGEEKAMENISKKEVIESLVATESSEWNDIFLYAVNSLQTQSKELQYIAATMQAHKDRIVEYIKSLPEADNYLEAMNKIPKVWDKRILIVDDEPMILSILKALIEDLAVIETAQNGQEALLRVKEQYFDVIISDISMPVLNGIEFYRQASFNDPNIRNRFLFYTGNPTDDYLRFFSVNNLQYLTKPAPIGQIQKSVQNILKQY
ncbi:MAG: response regulator [Thermodesulfovibrionales bacterium]